MFKQILNTFLTKVLAGIFNLVIAVVLSNYLGAAGKGIQGLILTTISISVIITGVIGQGGLTYLIPRLNLSVILIPSYIWTFFIAAFIWPLLYVLKIVPDEYIIHVVILSIILAITGINNSILHANKKIENVNLINIIQILITVLVIVFLIVIRHQTTVISYIISLYFGYFAALVVSFYLTKGYYYNTKYKFGLKKYLIALKQLLKFGSYNQLDTLAQVLSFRLAYYFLNSFVNITEVGIYSNAVSIIESVWILSRSISFVQHSRLVNSRDKLYISALTLTFIKLTGIIALMSIIVLMLIPSVFYQYVFGNEFGAVRMAIISLSPGVLFFSISFVLSSYFSGTGKHYINTISSISGLVAIILSSLLLIPKYGILGAGFSASFSYLITTLIKGIYFVKQTDFKIKQLLPHKDDVKDFILLIKK